MWIEGNKEKYKRRRGTEEEKKIIQLLPSSYVHIILIHNFFHLFYSIQSPVQEAELNWPLQQTQH
jgi:hypothetical protein